MIHCQNWQLYKIFTSRIGSYLLKPDTWLQAVVITAISTSRGGGISTFLGGENVVPPSNQMTVIVSTISKQVKQL